MSEWSLNPQTMHLAADSNENLGTPFAAALTFHLAIVALSLSLAWWRARNVDPFGDPNPGAGAIGVSAVKTIPVFQRPGRVQELANDTETEIEKAPEEKKKPAEKIEDDDAIPLNTKRNKRRDTDVAAELQRYRPNPTDTNRVYSNAGAAATSKMLAVSGGGNVGLGPNSPLGNRFGWYADLLRQKVGDRWKVDDIDLTIKTSPPAIVSFEIMRDGSVRNIKLLQRSGVNALDYSGQRAIQEASPFPPLPAQFEKDSVTVEFQFELKR